MYSPWILAQHSFEAKLTRVHMFDCMRASVVRDRLYRWPPHCNRRCADFLVAVFNPLLKELPQLHSFPRSISLRPRQYRCICGFSWMRIFKKDSRVPSPPWLNQPIGLQTGLPQILACWTNRYNSLLSCGTAMPQIRVALHVTSLRFVRLWRS